MSLSTKSGVPIGRFGKKIIYYDDDELEDAPYEMSEFKKDIDDINTAAYGKKGRRVVLTEENFLTLYDSILYRERPKNFKLLKYYDNIVNKLRESLSKEYTAPVDVNKHIKPIPYIVPEQISSFLISGISGSGKSVYASNLAVEYHRHFPKNKVYLISAKEADKAFDSHTWIIRVDVDEDWCIKEDREKGILSGRPSVEMFADSMVVFDDISYETKKLTKAVNELRDICYLRGRAIGVHVITIVHVLLNWEETRIPLQESQTIVVFPKRMHAEHVKIVCKANMGMSISDINRCVRITGTRFISITKYPKLIITEREIYLRDQ